MCVNVFRLCLTLLMELVSNVLYCLLEVLSTLKIPSTLLKERKEVNTFVFRKANAKINIFDLLLKNVFLVEEENDWSFGEPFAVSDVLKDLKTLMHSIGADIFS